MAYFSYPAGRQEAGAAQHDPAQEEDSGIGEELLEPRDSDAQHEVGPKSQRAHPT